MDENPPGTIPRPPLHLAAASGYTAPIMPETLLLIRDTTLRDGEQMPGALLDPDDKLDIARALAEAGVDVIEAGFPAASPLDARAVELIAEHVPGPVISVLCRAVAEDIEAGAAALAKARPDRRQISVFLAASKLHREHKLKKSKTEILDLVRESVALAKSRVERVHFSAEDASRTEPDFLVEVYAAAISAGAASLSFPDTVGVLTPEGVRRALRGLNAALPNRDRIILSAHFHDDLGLATANTLAAAEEGADMVSVTVGGIGERAGNAALEEVALTLDLHRGQYRRETRLDLARLYGLCRLVAERTGIPLPPHKAVAGANVFTSAAGVHQDGLLKHPDTYLPFRPERVGAPPVRLSLSRQSGRAALARRLAEMGHKLSVEELAAVAEIIKTAPKAEWADETALLDRALARTRKAAPAVTAATPILDILANRPSAEAVIRARDAKAGRCLCCEALFEPIGAVAERHGLDLAALLNELNAQPAKERP